MSEPEAGTYVFSLEIVDSQIKAAEVQRRLEEALRDAVAAMERDGEAQIEAKAEVQGAFGGVGETLVVLALAFFTGAAKKAGEKAGEEFYTKYLAPRLRKLNLIPRGFRKREGRGVKDDRAQR